MERKYMERLKGKYCKIVTMEPGSDRASVITGILEDVDYIDGLITVDSCQGLGCLSIDTIVAIKPKNGNKKSGKRIISIRKDEKAVVGIGILIVFIAMVLVAAVAASFLIQTSESLQQVAQSVGRQTIREVSTGCKIIDITGYTDENKSVIEFLAITVKPRAGSYDIDLTETLLYIQYENLTVLHHSNNSNLTHHGAKESGIFHTLDMSLLNATNYGVIATHDSDRSVSINYGMSTEDTVMLIINLTYILSDTNGLEPGEEFFGRLVPEIGAHGSFLVDAPTVFDHRVVQL